MDSDRRSGLPVPAIDAGPEPDPERAPAGIGDRLLRLEDNRLLRGAGRFVEDIMLPGEARAVFLRSPHAHARIRSLSLEAARAAPGVLAVLTGADVAADGLGGVPWEVRPPTDTPPDSLPPLGDPSVAAPQPLIADDTVRFCGEIVAMVVAESEAAARGAAELIAADYDPLPASADSAEAAAMPALWPQAPGNLGFTVDLGDRASTDAAFAAAAHIESIELASNRIFGAPLENRACIGECGNDGGRMVLHANGGKPHSMRKTLAAQIFHIPPGKIAVKVPDVGGGFGIKNVLYPEQCLVMWAARRLGRPVKWIGRRDEGLLSDVGCREQASRAEMALDGEGRILAVRVRSTGNLGAYLAPRGVVSLRNSGFVIANVYSVPAIGLRDARVAFQHRADLQLPRRRRARRRQHHRAADRCRGPAPRPRPRRDAPAQPAAAVRPTPDQPGRPAPGYRRLLGAARCSLRRGGPAGLRGAAAAIRSARAPAWLRPRHACLHVGLQLYRNHHAGRRRRRQDRAPDRCAIQRTGPRHGLCPGCGGTARH